MPCGFQLNIAYQVLGDDGTAFQQSGLVPLETANDVTIDGDNTGTMKPGFGPLGEPTDAQGQFHDTPYGLCSVAPSKMTLTQIIAFDFGGARIVVRTNSVVFQPTAPGKGTVSNGTDVKVTIP